MNASVTPVTPVKKKPNGERAVVKGQAASQTTAYRQDHVDREPFAPLRQNNLVECYINGQDYFEALHAAMASATSSIFITGWQVDWDVEIAAGLRLIDILHERIQANKKLRVYVLPWMSPKVGVNTHDLDTMLAIFQLNAGLEKMQAFCCSAAGQSDYVGSEGAAFSHHQKAVVVDNRIAFVGGMDVAYGRRDDARFSLHHGARRLNERYNPGIPALHPVSAGDTPLLSTLDLLESTLRQVEWQAGGNTEQGALANLLDTMSAKAKTLSMQALAAAIQIDRRSRHAAQWLIDTNRVLLEKAGGTMENAARDAANSLSRQCAGYQMLDLYGAAQAMRVDAAASPVADSVRQVETGARETYNGAVAAIASIHEYVAPLARLRISPSVPYAVAGAAAGAERAGRSAYNKTVDAASAGGGAVQGVGNAALRACVEIAPAVGQGIDAGKARARAAADVAARTVNELQAAVISQLNTLRQAVNDSLLDLDRLSKDAANAVLNAVTQEQIQAVVDASTRFLKDAYFAQLAINWRSARQHPKLLDQRSRAAVSHELADGQPRQPWQDLHTRIEGPAVYDVALNFIQRWNACQHSYLDGSFGMNMKKNVYVALKKLMKTHVMIGSDLMPEPPIGKIPATNVAVRVLRSAPIKLCRQEREARGDKRPALTEQCEIQTQMVNLIRSATDFVYIENQFYQTEFGNPSIDPFSEAGRKQMSAPMRYLMTDAMNDIKARLSSNKAPGKSLYPNNPIGSALSERIAAAIRHGQPFHVYMILPEHPEGRLDDITIVGQIHWTMQSLVFADRSLINRIRAALAAKKVCRNPLSPAEWNAALEQAYASGAHKAVPDKEWQRYLTLLNLRSCDVLGGVLRTQQVYVHSKLLIVDDRHVIIGSANINDRSMSGKRDSELSVLLLDTAKVRKTVRHETMVNPLARNLREALWRKHFALMGNGNSIVQPATALAACIDKPAADQTIAMIQDIAARNSQQYADRFLFVPRSDEGTALPQEKSPSIWPRYSKKPKDDVLKAAERMPFHEKFWTSTQETVAAKPDISGYITRLPLYWTYGENNHPGEMSVMVLTQSENSVNTGPSHAHV